jgi:hypothetical protein
MSAVIDEPTTVPAGPPARGPRSGSLLRAELRRFRARRFIQVLLALALLGWLAATVIGLTQFGTPTEEDYAAARQQVAQVVADSERFREECLTDPSRPEEVPADGLCGPPVQASDFDVDDFVGKAPFDLGATGQAGAAGFGGAAAVLAFLVGATWIGAEWSTRSVVALLFWVPQRLKVMGTKLGVLVLASALFGVAMQLGWLAMAGILRAVAGSGNALPDGFWGDLLATQGRSVLLAVLVALIGFGLANLVRNTGAALGIGFVYFAILETALRILRPTWEPWLLSNNALGLISPGGTTIFIQDGTPGPNGLVQPTEYVIGNLQAGVYLGVVTVVVVGIGVVLFARRDLH